MSHGKQMNSVSFGFAAISYHRLAILLIFIFLALVLSSCGGASEEINCKYLLNEKEFDQVANDETCSTYERASAEMGLAGFLFSNFLADDAADNLKKALGIPNSATSWNSWEGKTHYENARKLTGDSTGDNYENKTRLNQDIEIHYFATMGALLAQTYIELDQNADGEIAENEIQAFTRIRPIDDSEYGQNDFSGADWMQFVKDKDTSNEKVYLLNMQESKCQLKTTDPKYDGVWSSTAATYDITSDSCGLITLPSLSDPELLEWYNAGQGSISVIGECSGIAKVNNIQNLFLTAENSSSLGVLELTENFVSYINSINKDLGALGMAEDSDLRETLNNFVQNIDNGAACANTTMTEVNQILDIIDIAAQDATTDYKNKNVMKTGDLNLVSDTSLSLLEDLSSVFEILILGKTIPITISFSCSNASDLSARLIYKSGDNYIAYYSDADPGISNTFSTMKSMNFDDEGNEKPAKKGDEIITFTELLCLQ